MEDKIKSFTDLNAWKEGHKLVLLIYKITKVFSREEMFGITNQIRRAAVSITSNLAEGFSRNTYKDKVQFYCMSLGSLTELQNQLLITKDVHYLTREEFDNAAKQSVVVSKLINGLIKSSKAIIHNS